MDPLLLFDSVSFSYHSVKGETPAVKNLSFSVNPGDFTVLVGPSGCGNATGIERKDSAVFHHDLPFFTVILSKISIAF